jgi:sodium transport system permease protein
LHLLSEFRVIFIGVAYISGKAINKAESQVLKYSVINEQALPAIPAQFMSDEGFERITLEDSVSVEAAINQQQVDFVLELPADAQQKLAEGTQVVVTLHMNDAELNFVYDRANDLVVKVMEDYRNQALLELGVSEEKQAALLKPIRVEKQDVSEQRENWGEKIGGFLPYLLLFACLMGAIPVATDIAAGEKERGTLETLLLAPMPRNQLILGKFITVAIVGALSALLNVVSLFSWGLVLGQGMAAGAVADFMSQISVIDMTLIFLMLLPVVAIFSASLLSLSIYARSFKEAQSYMGILPLVVIMPVMLAMLPGIKLEDGWAWMPLTNVSLAMKELLKGTMDYWQLLSIFASSVLIAGALFAFCVYWFKQEKVLFR